MSCSEDGSSSEGSYADLQAFEAALPAGVHPLCRTKSLQPATFTLEVCMTQLAEPACQQFFFGVKGTTAEAVTEASGAPSSPTLPASFRHCLGSARPMQMPARPPPRHLPLATSARPRSAAALAPLLRSSCVAPAGIRAMFPDALIDDFLFEPCGYSMNGLQGAGLMTIHVTPESHCSYASVEISGHDADAFDPQALLAAACAIFQPGRVTVALSGDAPAELKAWAAAPALPKGMALLAQQRAKLAGGGFVSYVCAATK